jgi:uncharacterized phage-associated protein
MSGRLNSVPTRIASSLPSEVEPSSFVRSGSKTSKQTGPTVFDVAAYILERMGSMSHMKLQKLVYYCQAWSLVWKEKPIFSEKIEAWANGPVVKELFKRFQGEFTVSSVLISQFGSPNVLTDEQKSTIDSVIEFYGDKNPQWLSDLTHLEAPWRNARIGLSDDARSNREITLASMAEYYGSL